MIRRALGQVADILDISARRINLAADDRVAAGVGVVGAVEESADRVVWTHLGGGQEGERRCEGDDGGGEAHFWGSDAWEGGSGGCGKVGLWEEGMWRFFEGSYVVTEISGIKGRDEGALIEDVLVLQMRHPVFFPSVWQECAPVDVPRIAMGICRAAWTWQLR